ncbi:MAG: CmpA/NrtA family ABC transporter substrate-binding protein [Sphingobium sp.]|uniref:CmpA/NrtA family ABC transporter substrate-binding protein n=1 Tax=Sphingobium sp. TaxID=1912891 RepID=UPI0029A08AAF|nr:CmpA/NrtA family ABC transporter substrate-binding protein [Sphingobium sp.]MDX3909676.1 CmpA/NrtA family ABC transporter substrate-binding protein [Sphingobium sp.]
MSLLRIGFLPLVDAVLPIVAHEYGLAEKQGLKLELHRDTSWATVRDRLIYGQTDAAHLLAPLALATSLGLDRPAVPLAAPFMLGLNGNTVNVSSRVAALLGDLGGDVAETGRTLAALAKSEAAAGRKLRIAVVHRYSSHNYMLRYWLGASGCNPDSDVDIVTVPPPFIAEAFALGEIDGSCVGEPWNSVAAERGDAVTIAATSQLWNRGVEKLLACRLQTLDERREEMIALVRALHAAGSIAESREHRDDVAELLSRPEYVGQPASLIARALSSSIATRPDTPPVRDFLVLHREAANFPWRSQAMWLYSQMARWGHAPLEAEGFVKAAAVFRPDIYRAALAGTGAILPNASAKVEGAIAQPLGVGSASGRLIMGPDRFFDGRLFDPDKAMEYLAELSPTAR